MDPDRLLEAAAANLAAWHQSSIRALGFECGSGDWWWTAPTPGPWIYFTAIGLRRPRSRRDRRAAITELRRHLAHPSGSFEAVCESFGGLDLAPLGLTRRTKGLWYVHPPDPVAVADVALPPPTGALVISEVRTEVDLAAFETATCLAFGAPAPVATFEIHAPGILDDPAMHVLIARVPHAGRDDEPPVDEVVAGAMVYVTDEVAGIYGVGTIPRHRGRGHATAITAACLAIAPDRPITLQPSVEAASMYRRLGFDDLGRFVHWG